MEFEDLAYRRALNGVRLFFVAAIAVLLLGSSLVQPANPQEALRKYTRAVEFDFSEWTVKSLFAKAVQSSLKAEKFLSNQQQAAVTKDYFNQVEDLQQKTQALNNAVFAPQLDQRTIVTKKARIDLMIAQRGLDQLSLMAESVLQTQTEMILAGMGFGIGGQILPPVLYRVTDLPLDIIISPRTEIRTLMDFSLNPGLDTLEKEKIEVGIQNDYDLSALIEPVGGIGAYPTMVMQSADLNWLSETVAHEWIHNYLTFTPLGMRYSQNGELRTINETTASIAGKEVSQELLLHYYPDRVSRYFIVLRGMQTVRREAETEPDSFDFRAEMRATRIQTEALLLQGEVALAEDYMEARRQVFWEHGYQIRKINQAYFAFYGSYNDHPGGGAAGADPVGPAVQALRKQEDSLHAFIMRIDKVTSFADLQKLLRN